MRMHKPVTGQPVHIEYDFQLISQAGADTKRAVVHTLYKLRKASPQFKLLQHYLPKMISFNSLLEFECEVR